jgi:hypothetical protein
MSSSSSKIIGITRQTLFVLKYAVCGAILVGSLIFIFFNLFSSIATGSLSYSSSNSGTEILSFYRDTPEILRLGTHFPLIWIGIYIGFLIGWAIGWHRLKEKKATFRWSSRRVKTMRRG